jgi:hypothetical protein
MGTFRSFKFLKTLAVAVIFIGAFYTPRLIMAATTTTTVSIEAPSRVSPGQSFDVSIMVEPGGPLAGLQLSLSYDASALTLSQITEGSLLSQGGAASYFLPGTQEAGVVSGMMGVIITPDKTVSESGVFAVLTFTAGAEGGASGLSLSDVIVGDASGQSMPVSSVGAEVTINQAPVLAELGNQSVNEGQLLEFSLSASDANGDALSYSAVDLPDGATFNADSRSFSWTPGYTQAGSYDVTFRVSDGLATVEQTITITVNKVYEDWDVNMDGRVNVLDMTAVGQHWGQTGEPGWCREDVNNDGAINVLDMTLIGQHWTG